MNDEKNESDPPGVGAMFRDPAARTYLFLGIVALFIYYVLMAGRSEGGSGLGALLALCIAIPGLLSRWVISPALFMLLSTYLMFDPNFGRLVGMPYSYRVWRPQLEFGDIMLGGTILVYLMAQFRLLSLVQQSMPDDPPPRRKGQPEPTTPRRPTKLFVDREVGTMLIVAPICIVSGLLAWSVLIGYESEARLGGYWGIERTFARLMLFVWVLVTTTVVVQVVLRYREMTRMSRREGRLMLQDQFWQETRREQERIYRWRRWYRERTAPKTPRRG